MPFGPDRPLPADFEVSPIVTRKKKANFPHPGRAPGVLNKLSRDLKAGVIEGAAAYGSDGAGTGGLHG